MEDLWLDSVHDAVDEAQGLPDDTLVLLQMGAAHGTDKERVEVFFLPGNGQESHDVLVLWRSFVFGQHFVQEHLQLIVPLCSKRRRKKAV